MGLITFFLLVLFAITSFYLGYFRSNRVRVIEKQRPFSLDKYYGYYLAIWSVVPAVIILFAILIFDGFIVKNYVLSEFYSQGIDQSEISLLFTQIENTRNGIKLFNSEDEIIVNAVNKLNYIEGIFDITSIITVFSVSSLFLLYGYRKINLNFDARLIVEKFILIGFFLCSLIAILVTIGIIFSLLYETVRFRFFIWDKLESPKSFCKGCGRRGRYRKCIWCSTSIFRYIFDCIYSYVRINPSRLTYCDLYVRICKKLCKKYCKTNY